MSDNIPDPRITNFIEKLDELDAGAKARLKRCAGQTLAEARHQALGLFYSILPYGISQQQEEIYFLIATMYPLAENVNTGDLGISIRKARQKNNSKSLDRRVEILLDADETQLPFRLRQTIHFLKSCEVGVNFIRLLDDLLWWNHPERRVQRRWARSYFSE